MPSAIYPDLLKDYANAPPLPTEKNADGKSLKNLVENTPRSAAYDTFPTPIASKGDENGFDFHIYYNAKNAKQKAHAYALHEQIRREFPEFRIYRLWDTPIGPHLVAMFEVNIFTPLQFGTLMAFLVVNRGPLSVLIHPNTGDHVADHTTNAIWMGERLPVDLEFL